MIDRLGVNNYNLYKPKTEGGIKRPKYVKEDYGMKNKI